jgi:hypothetical protein
MFAVCRRPWAKKLVPVKIENCKNALHAAPANIEDCRAGGIVGIGGFSFGVGGIKKHSGKAHRSIARGDFHLGKEVIAAGIQDAIKNGSLQWRI